MHIHNQLLSIDINLCWIKNLYYLNHYDIKLSYFIMNFFIKFWGKFDIIFTKITHQTPMLLFFIFNNSFLVIKLIFVVFESLFLRFYFCGQKATQFYFFSNSILLNFMIILIFVSLITHEFMQFYEWFASWVILNI